MYMAELSLFVYCKYSDIYKHVSSLRGFTLYLNAVCMSKMPHKLVSFPAHLCISVFES